MSAIAWVVLWLGVNTGPWVFRSETVGLRGWIHYVRTALPFGVEVLGFFAVLRSRSARLVVLRLPVSAWLAYGLVGLVASAFSPRPWDAIYWALMYLSAFAGGALFLQGEGHREEAERNNRLTWLVATGALLVLLVAARDALFVQSAQGYTGYGVVNRIGTVGGAAMSRSSGLSRLSAIPGILAFGLLWSRTGVVRLACACTVISSGALVYFMQSRGSIVSFAGALVFVLLFQGPRARRAGILGLVLVGVLLLGDLIPDDTVASVKAHLLRGQDIQQLSTLTGRTGTWERILEASQDSLLIGHGFQADRFLLGEHAHNSYAYALLVAGVVGVVLFALGLASFWWSYLGLLRRPQSTPPSQKEHLVLIGALMAFFSLRGIPEVSGSMFGVDLLIMLPAMMYVGAIKSNPEPPSEAW